MTFDEQLQRAFDTLADRLREEIARHLSTATGELTASVESERAAAAAEAARDARGAAEREAVARLTEAVAAAEARGRETGRQEGTQASRAAGRQEGLEEGRQKARAEFRSTELAASGRLVDAIRSMDRGRSLSEILDTLASCAAREAARVGVLLVQGEQLLGWRFIGFGPALEDASGFELPLAEAGIIADAVQSGTAASSDSGPHATAPSFAQLAPGREMLAVPVPMSGQVVAVLYADQASDPPDRDAPLPDPHVAWPTVLEVLARHAARCLEAITAVKAVQVFTERLAPAPSIPRDSAERGSADGPDEANKQDDEDEAALRYARLLVSEIKLYHESAVIAGRRDRDVGARLGSEIARARVLYEQRVPAHVRRATDHFHAELVRTLADGDPSLLGQPT